MMLLRRLLLCVPLLGLGGCSWIPYAIDNACATSSNFFTERHFEREAKALADQAWSEIACAPGRHGRSSAYEKGFKAGFFDYLDCNGNCDPKAVPPRYLRKHAIRTDSQQQDIVDWFAGFRHGAETAADARWRDRIVIPISLPPRREELGYRSEIIPNAPRPRTDGGVPGVVSFDAPQPRTSTGPRPLAMPAPVRDIVPAGGVGGVLIDE